MKAEDATLQAILNSPNQYVIPVFQRYYSWSKENWETLWTDITELLDPDQPSRAHFMGSLVFVPEPLLPNKVPAFQIIDGQQRMTTLSLLLCALRDLSHSRNFDTLAEEITKTFLVHPYKHGREQFRVYPRQRDRAQYMAAVTDPDSINATGPIGDAVRYFYDRIAELPESHTEEGLREFFGILKARLEFVHITLQGENPYRIFRSLNSTGVDLSEGDLIRNFMFMHVSLDKQDDFDDELWKPLEARFEDLEGKISTSLLSNFFRDFLMRTGQYVPPTATFQIFERTYDSGSFKADALARELAHHAALYDIIRGVNPHPHNAVNAALKKLRQLDSSTTYPLLLNLMLKVEQGIMNEDDLLTSIEMLAGFILRRFICGEQSRAYGRWFVSACANIGNNPLPGLAAFLANKGFPNNATFKARFTHANIYGSRYGRSILETLELTFPDKERASLANASIEHIMPQTLTEAWRTDLGLEEAERIHAEWLNTIGNLTLTAYNSELQNDSFADKSEEYAKSHINLTRQIAQDYTTWTETDILDRGQRLAERAAKVWVGPEA